MPDNVLPTTPVVNPQAPNTPAAPAAQGAPSPAPGEQQVTQPTQPVQPVQPVPALDEGPTAKPDFKPLGQPQQPQGTQEAQWLRQQYAQSLEQLAAAQQQLEDLQLAGLSEEEQVQEKLRRQVEQFQQQQQAWQYEQAVGEWKRYYSQFADYTGGQIDLNQVNDPVQMGHQVTTALATRVSSQQQEIATLKAQLAALQNANTGATPPPVSTGADGGAAGRRTWRDMTPVERAQYDKRIRMGLASVNDIV